MIEFISQLPIEYQEVEYIQSSGTQYIDTSVIPTVNTRVVLDIDVLSYPGDYLAIFGERHTTQTTNLFSFWVSSATTFRTDFGSSTGNTTITASVIGRYVIDKNKNVTTVQGITATNPTSTIQTTYPIYLLSNNYGGTADDRRPIAKIYSCQIYDSDILVRNFVPCYRISDNAAGLYDLVNGVFYANVGSGTFTVGANSNKHSIVTITPGGVISFSATLRRRMMMAGGGAFEFTYTGQFTDKIEGSKRVIKLTSSGILQVSADVDVDVYLLAGGGGAIMWVSSSGVFLAGRNGGNGGSINKSLVLTAHYTYEVTIGEGGKGHYRRFNGSDWQHTSGTGGQTQAFGLTCTGGTGAVKDGTESDMLYDGTNGSPYNGATNGGRGQSQNTIDGGDGYVTITIPI